MTNPTQHGQVPEALIDLIDAYADRCGSIYNARTEAARNAVIEALSGVQALSAAPAEQEEAAQRLRKTLDIDPGDVNDPLHPRYIAGFKSGHAAGRGRADAAASPTPPAEYQAQLDECFPGEPKVAVPQGLISAACFAIRKKRDGGKVLEQLRRYSVGDRSQPLAPQQAAPKAAPGVGNSGFDHKTAADLLNNKTVSDEAVRNFVATSRWAHDERAALSATLLAMHGVLTSREEEIALLKKALLEAEAPPQQEAQEPCGWTTGITWRPDTRLQSEQVIKITRDTQPKYGYTTPIYTAPQPAPLSDDVSQKTWALLDELEKLRGADRYDEDWDTLNKRDDELRAALAAHGGKDA